MNQEQETFTNEIIKKFWEKQVLEIMELKEKNPENMDGRGEGVLQETEQKYQEMNNRGKTQ